MGARHGEIFITHAHAALVLIEREHVAAIAELHVRPAPQPVDQDVLEIGLVEAIAEVPAHWSEVLRARPIQDQTALCIEEAHARTQKDKW